MGRYFFVILFATFLFSSCAKNEKKEATFLNNNKPLPKETTLYLFPENGSIDMDLLANDDLDGYYIVRNNGGKSNPRELVNQTLSRTSVKNTEARICEVRIHPKTPLKGKSFNHLKKEIFDCVSKLAEVAKDNGHYIKHVVSFPNAETGVELGGEIRDTLGVKSYHGIDYLKRFIDKGLMKEVLRNSGEDVLMIKEILSREFVVDNKVDEDKLRDIYNEKSIQDWEKFVLKPTNGITSVGIEILENPGSADAFLSIVNNYNKKLKTGDYIIEEFIDGVVHRTEGYVNGKGELKISMTSSYHVPPQKHYQDHSMQMTKRILDDERFVDFAKKVLKGLDGKNIVFHLESIKRGDDIYFLEIAARVGGTLPGVLADNGFDIRKAHILAQKDEELTTIELNRNPLGAVYLDFPETNGGERYIWLSRTTSLDEFDLAFLQKNHSSIKNSKLQYYPSRRLVNLFFSSQNENDEAAVYDEMDHFYKNYKALVRYNGGAYHQQWGIIKNGQFEMLDALKVKSYDQASLKYEGR